MNHLAGEQSPYLLQHADNPVDWYPWGEESHAKARAEDKPIFLSIGYAACHWCHVMAHESFEDEETARLLNEHFVNIKVDREERPDIDRIYMAAVQALTSSGGWPLSVFLTPDLEPFFGGTYYPPTRRHGLPAFREVLLAVQAAWRDRRDQVTASSAQIAQAIAMNDVSQMLVSADDLLDPYTLELATLKLGGDFDKVYGGWGRAPKFPQPMALEFLLRRYATRPDAQALEMITRTLDALARGGIYDQVGGGFHRYSVDERWLTPHFEKMLYDNAQLALVYLHAWQVTGTELYRAVVEETLDYIKREMTDLDGGFYASQDADSEGQEGKFYLWSADEIRAALGTRAAAFMAAYGITEEGNFEGQNILHLTTAWEERLALAQERAALRRVRTARRAPARDDKVLAAWNGLMLAAAAEAGVALGRADYLDMAVRNADFLLRELRTAQGRLLRSWRHGRAKGNAFLEDYTHLIYGLLALYRADFSPRWLAAARELAEQVIAHFRAELGFYDTSDDHEELLVRPREFQDNATPSGNAMAAYVLLQLAHLADEPQLADLARGSLRAIQPLLVDHPLAFVQWLVALDYAVAPIEELTLVGALDSPDTHELLAIAHRGYAPHRILCAGLPDAPGVPLLAGRERIGGRATAYVCRNAACLAPVTNAPSLVALLAD